MTQFSVIVPFAGCIPAFEDTLASVLRHRPDHSQVIVVHDGSYDDPYGLQEEVDWVASDQDSNLIHLLNLAMQWVQGRWTVLIRPGVEIDENWEDSVENVLRDPGVASVVPILVRADEPQRMVAAGISTDRTCTRRICGMGQSCSSLVAKRWRSIGPSSWLAVYRSSVLRALAPFDERLDAHYIDVDIALSMLELGLKSCVDPEFVATVDTEAPIVAEAKCPHGRSAQRAIQRFANHQKSTTLGNCVTEILQIPLRPWKFSHLLQRLGARKTLRFDGDFARRLSVAAAEECWTADDREQQGQTAARKRAA